MRVTAAVLRHVATARPYDRHQPLELTDLELDEPGPGEVLVRVKAAGLCHSDLSTIDGNRPRPTPMALGHEVAGEVVGLGSEDSLLRVGDHVIATFVPSCGHCHPCRDGRPALCEPGAVANSLGELLSGGVRLHEPGGGRVNHHLGVSGFSDHIVVSERSLVAIDPGLPWEVAALFGCAVLTGVGAVVNSAGVRMGQSLVIFGLGGVGLSALLGAMAVGANPILVVDPMAGKRELALQLGASHALDATADVVEQIKDATGGGADHALETVGAPSVLAQAFSATRRGGVTTTVGLPAPSAQLTVAPLTLTAEERVLQGSYMGSSVPAIDIPRFIGLHQAGRLPVDKLLTHRLTLSELNEGFERLARAEAIRQVVVFD
ncbi:MAG TPA: zinc-dependent alcohol dehydrogenase family protein [Acidimicrobiia bacterium]|nr:zinc-dependent alcohol dehydrogenase family protein [Acidimicrobiia bacterium]